MAPRGPVEIGIDDVDVQVASRARHIDGFLDDLDRELELLKTVPADEVDTTLLVHPTLFPDFFVFNDFLNVADEVLQPSS